MNIPILIHADPREVRESSVVQIGKGVYEVITNKVDTQIKLQMGGQAYDSVSNGFRFVLHLTEKLKAVLLKSGSESSLSLSLRKVE